MSEDRVIALQSRSLLSEFLRFLLRHRMAVMVLVGISLGLAAWSARRIEVRFQYRDFYDYPGNKDMPLFSKYSEEFGDPAGFVVVLVEADDVFRKDVLEYIQTVTRELEPEPLFSHVKSLTNAKTISGDGDDVSTGLLMAKLPTSPEEVARVRRIATQSTLLVRRLIAPDSTATAILAEMKTPATLALVAEQRSAIAAVRKVLDRHPAPANARVRISGGPVTEVETTRTLTHDLLLFTPVCVLLIVIALFFTFRSVGGVLLPLSAVTVALTWTAGIFACFHHPVDMVGSTMTATLLVYGVVDPIFVLVRNLQKLQQGLGRDDAIIAAEYELRLPCFLTSLTTALGFFSFGTASLPTVAVYGITVGIGVVLSWVTTLVVLPVLLSFMPEQSPASSKKLESGQWLDRRLTALWRLINGVRVPMLVGALVLLGVGSWYGMKQHLSSVYVGNLPNGDVLDAVHVLEKKLSGVARTVVYFEGEDGVMKRPDVVRAIGAVDAFAETYPMVNTSISIADLVAEENQAFHGGDLKERRVPQSGPLIAQYLSLLDPDDRADFVDAAYSHTHLRILTEDVGSEPIRAFRVELEKVIAANHFAELGVKVGITGSAMVGFGALDKIVIEMLWGFVIAFGVIVTLVFLIFRSLRVALMSVVPNLIPVVASFAFLRLAHISLRMDTALFLSVSVGGLFNTTIHLVARVRQRLAEGETDPDLITEHAVRTVGPPALFTAVILSLGFASFMLSGFPGLRAFGMLAMITLLVGFCSDMIVTAILLRLFYAWPKRAVDKQPVFQP